MLLLLLVPALILTANAQGSCQFSVPDLSGSGCWYYDLTALYNPAGYTVQSTTDSDYTYLINVCGNIVDNVPSYCGAADTATGYQIYGQNECLVAGTLNPTYAGSVDTRFGELPLHLHRHVLTSLITRQHIQFDTRHLRRRLMV